MLYIKSDIVQGSFVPHDLAALSGNYYRIGGYPATPFITPANARYLHFDPGKVDWIDVGLDGGGLVCDLLAYGIPGRVLNGGKAIKGATKIGDALNVVGVVRGMGQLTPENVSWVDVMSLGFDAAGFFIPLGPDAMGLIFDFGKAFSP